MATPEQQRTYHKQCVKKGKCVRCSKKAGKGHALCEYHRKKINDAHWPKRYRITREQFEQICIAQDGACAICGQIKKLVGDHDHKTYRFRGAICTKCNSGLGHFDDSILGLQRAIDYLRNRIQ